MNNNNEGTKRGYNNNGNGNNRRFNNNRRRNNNDNASPSVDYKAKKAELIKKQTANLDMIDKVSGFLDGLVKDTKDDTRITMKQIIDFLNENGYDKDSTKTISQYNYLLMDLANAQICNYISGNRLNIRILYIQERLKSSYKKELTDAIETLFGKHSYLFKWAEDTGDGEVEFTYTTTETPANELVKEDSAVES